MEVVKSSMLDAIMETFVDNKVTELFNMLLAYSSGRIQIIYSYPENRGNCYIVWCVYQDYPLVLEIRELLEVCTAQTICFIISSDRSL